MSAISQVTDPDPRRWRALAVLGLIQFILVVDVSIVNARCRTSSTTSTSRAQAWLGSSTATW